MTREAFDERQAKRRKSVEEMEPEPDELKNLNFKERVALQRAKEEGFCEPWQLPPCPRPRVGKPRASDIRWDGWHRCHRRRKLGPAGVAAALRAGLFN